MLPTFTALLPQTILVVAACLFLLGGTFTTRRALWGPLSLLAILAAAVSQLCMPHLLRLTQHGLAETAVASPMILQDPIAVMFNWVFLLLGAAFVALAMSDQKESSTASEFYALLLTLVSGLMVVSSANELILLFLGLELISIPTYVLLYLGRRDVLVQEATTKYFLLSIMSAAVLLYGFSFLYGLTGTTNLTGIRTVLSLSVAAGSRMGILALVLIFAGLGFKVAAVPFHFYAPDVYQGVNAWGAGLLAVAPKAAGFVALIRVASHTMVGYETTGEIVALILALITMTAGNVMALLQTNVRRLLAYSSIAHAGYMLVGIAVGFWDSTHPLDERINPQYGLPNGIQACLYYLITYSLVSSGLFAVLVYLQRPGRQIEHIEDLTGLWRTQPWIALSAAIFLFSLAGIPPLPGFWGKLTIFAGALSARGEFMLHLPLPKTWFVVIAVAGMLNAAIGGVYYLRMIAIMFLHDPLGKQEPTGGRPAYAIVLVSAVATLLIGLQSRPLFSYLRQVQNPAVAALEVAPRAVAAMGGVGEGERGRGAVPVASVPSVARVDSR